METFLQIVAKDLYSKTGNDLSRVAVVFPNKRAGLFFNEYLASESDLPFWSPNYLSISELFENLSALKLADPVRLICELYPIFCSETKNDEPLDDFYFWGELLVSDFDDVDKNLVEADKLFRNLKNLKEIADGYDFLEKEQEEAIRQFFLNFSIEHHTELKKKFISMWDALGNIYKRFQENLFASGIAYEGMLYRDAIDKLDVDKLPYDSYVFVGFNALNKVETALFNAFQNAGKALFYWDYDLFYTQNKAYRHEAGMFINRNLSMFPSQLSGESFNNLSDSKTVVYLSASTENAQARYLPEWIRTTLTENERENAVILCNETLLLPVLHSIPEEVKNINVTMGFPLSQSPVYTFINALLELQITGYDPSAGRYTHATVQTVLKHPYTRSLSSFAEPLEQELTQNNRFYPFPSELKKDDFLTMIFTPQNSITELCRYIIELLKILTTLYHNEENTDKNKDTDDNGNTDKVFNQLYRESLFKGYTIVNRMLNLVENGKLNVHMGTLKQLLRKLLAMTNIPFHGEPAIGVQIMGVLETRNLDFKNLIILSTNEGLMPQGGGEASFIPYNLRKAFGMTTIEHRDAIYAYYFYRLIQRAEHVTFVYNTSSDGLNRGEVSRFLLQFLIEWPHPVVRKFLEAGQSPRNCKKIHIEKTTQAMERLYMLYHIGYGAKSNISPSALNTYLDCRLKFYFRYIAGLKVPNEVNTAIDSSTFGSIFHKAVELVYTKLTETGKLIRKEDLEKVLQNETYIQYFVDIAFKDLFFHVSKDEKSEYNGTQLINSKVIVAYVKQLLRNDLQYAPFDMIAMEKRIHEDIGVNTSIGRIQVRIGGIIDRIDSKEDTLRIVDYKTGGSPKIPIDIEQLFTRSDNRPGYIFQTFLYAAIMCRQQSLKVAPSLLYIHRAASDTYSPVIEMGEPRKPKMPVNNFAFLEDEFRERLQQLLEEIFDPSIPFTQAKESKVCEYCEFNEICGK